LNDDNVSGLGGEGIKYSERSNSKSDGQKIVERQFNTERA
jgi:hypothetical protein